MATGKTPQRLAPQWVQAYSGYVPGDLGAISTSATTNAEPSGTRGNIAAAKSVNSLNLTGATGVQMTGSGALTLVSGGLIANTSGGIRAGILKGSPSGDLTVNTVQDIVISSAIPDNGGPTALVKTGAGTLTLSGTTSYTGDTYLNNGTLVYIPPLNATYAGSIHGLGNLTKSGTATLTLTGMSDYSGATTITGGGLCVDGALGPNSAVTLQSSAVLSGSGTIGGDVTATGGTIALSPGGTILGAVTIGSGTLTVGNATGNYLSTAGGLNVTDGGALLVSPSATIVGNVDLSSSAESNFSGVLSGLNSVLTLDAPAGGTLTVGSSASSTYGGIVLQAGTLKIANTAALGSNALTINGGTLDLGGWSNFMLTTLAGAGGMIETSSGTASLLVNPSTYMTDNYSGSIADGAGSVSLVKEGAGTLVLSGSNTYSGGTTVEAGTLEATCPGALPNGSALTVGSDAAIFGGDLMPSGRRCLLPQRSPTRPQPLFPSRARWRFCLWRPSGSRPYMFLAEAKGMPLACPVEPHARRYLQRASSRAFVPRSPATASPSLGSGGRKERGTSPV